LISDDSLVDDDLTVLAALTAWVAFGRLPEVDDDSTAAGLPAAVLFFLAATRDDRRATVETDFFGGIADSYVNRSMLMFPANDKTT
jgi:hypothetical protein